MHMLSVIGAVSAPSGGWSTLIEWVHSWVKGGYGWTILVLILLLKVALIPLDYLIKHTSKKQSLVQQKLAPEIAKLNKKYGDNQQMIQQQTQALYKREKFNPSGSCVVMLVNLVVTMVIFFTLFSGLKTLSAYQSIEQYDSLHNTYIASVTGSYGSLEEYQKIANIVAKKANNEELSAEEQAIFTEQAQADWELAVQNAQTAIEEQWDSVKDSWLWVKNVWVADGNASPLPTLEALEKMATESKNQEYQNYVNSIKGNNLSSIEYNTIVNMVANKTGGWNGYYILAILSVGLSVLSQFINELSNKHKNKTAQQIVDSANPQGKSMWFMKLLLPVMMAMFVITTNAAFGIYVVTNSLISTLTGLLINVIINKVFEKKQDAVDEHLLKEVHRLEKRKLKGETK